MKEPKEKADELVRSFLEIRCFNTRPIDLSTSQAINCAIVCVDAIINSRKEDNNFDDTLSVDSSEYYSPHPLYKNYWLKVKEELFKLL